MNQSDNSSFSCIKASSSAHMTFLEHFHELRRRIWYSAICLIATFAVSYYFIDRVVQFIIQPVLAQQPDINIIYTTLPETFILYIKLSFACGFCLSTPFIMLQIYLFLLPGLHKREHYFISLLFIAFITMFTIGGAVAYYGILPSAIKFFLSYQEGAHLTIKLYIKISEYVSMILCMILGGGLTFQLPVILTALCRIGILDYQKLRKFRRFAIVIIFIIAAIVTPPDIGSQIILGLIMLLFYEITIYICKYISKK